jgi:transcriptional regulator with XRE-family HTH domain
LNFFSKNIKYLRKSRGYTQGELAILVNLKPNSISNYENSVSEPNFEQLFELIKILEVTPNEIFLIDLENTPVDLPVSGIHEDTPQYVGDKDKLIQSQEDIIALLKEKVLTLQDKVSMLQHSASEKGKKGDYRQTA